MYMGPRLQATESWKCGLSHAEGAEPASIPREGLPVFVTWMDEATLVG